MPYTISTPTSQPAQAWRAFSMARALSPLARIMLSSGTLKPSRPGRAPRAWVMDTKVSAPRMVVSQTKP
ncbi:hypothetical protein D3C80_1514810 [compost metagenome]